MTNRQVSSLDLLGAALVAALEVALVAFMGGPGSIVPGLLLVFFLPGYSLLALLYPSRRDVTSLERIALSLGMSLVIVPLIALALNFTPWGIRPLPLAVAVAAVTCALAGAAYRRRRLRGAYVVDTNAARTVSEALRLWWRTGTKMVTRRPNALVFVAALALVGAALFATIVPKTTDTFTEFALLDSSGTLRDYPHSVFVGDDVQLRLSVTNHEDRTITYRIVVLLDGTEADHFGPRSLVPGENWLQPIQFRVDKPDARQQAEFLLDVEGNAEPYRAVHLWLDVHQPS